MTVDELPQPPDHDLLQSTSDAIAVVLGQFPGLSLLGDVLDRGVQQWIRQRDREYMLEVVTYFQRRIDNHEERLKQITRERVEAFRMSLLATTEIARTNSDRSKQMILRNETINSAMPSGPDEDRRQIYIALTAALPAPTLRIFRFLAKPDLHGVPVASWRELETFNGDGPWETHTWDIVQQHVDGAPERDVVQHCFDELVRSGLVEYPGGGALPGITFPRVTNLGWDFYSFTINEDEENEGLTASR